MTTDLIALPGGSTHPLLGPLSLSPTTTPPQTSADAFDAADDFLVHEFSRRNLPKGSRVLVVNDRYGALAVALANDHEVTAYGDSFLSFRTTEANLLRNGREARFVTSNDPLREAAGAPFEFVVARIPKSLALFEAQLHAIREVVGESATVLCGGMEKHLSRRVNTLLDTLIGPSSASLGWHKARLIMAKATLRGTATNPAVPPPSAPFPSTYILREPKTVPIVLTNHASVFSRNGLDQGTRALVPFLATYLGDSPEPQRPLRVADLGCGNGVMGILSALSNPEADYSFFDESFMAVQSAKESWHAAFPDRRATFVTGDAMADTPDRWFDVILCNPPFHQDHAVGDDTAWRMFLSAHRSLAAGGSLLVVGNRHLNYHNKLKRLFGGVEQLGGTTKFVVLHARRP